MCSELGIEHCFVGFLPKPDVLIDDLAVADWRTLIEVHPNTAQSRTSDDYVREVSERFGILPGS